VIAVDTNVLVRLLTADDPAQTARAAALFEREAVLIPKTVLLETEWVLRYSYRLDATAVRTGFVRLFGLPRVTVEDESAVAEALALYERGVDFADALHLASAQGASAFATFDARLKKRAGGQARVRVL
jgi:predicted nucleic-acid-binding protein